MRVRFGKRKRILFTDRSHPIQGIVSVIFGLVALVALVSLCLLSSKAKGNAGLAVGTIGMLAMIVSIVGFFMALRCYRQEDIYRITPIIGSVLNGILFSVFLLLFFIGAM